MGSKRAKTDGRIVAAGSVRRECGRTNCRVANTVSIGHKRAKTNGRIKSAIGIVKECLIAKSAVAEATRRGISIGEPFKTDRAYKLPPTTGWQPVLPRVNARRARHIALRIAYSDVRSSFTHLN